MELALVGAAGAVLVAVVGGVLTHRSNRNLARRAAQLARVNQQLSELYGPMFAILESNEIAYRTFLRLHRGGADRFYSPDAEPPSDELKAVWRIWLGEVLQPGNRRVAELVKSKAHLLIDDEIPRPLLEFCAHVATWEVTLAQWKQGKVDEYWSGMSHPGPRVNAYALESLKTLKSEQKHLLELTAVT